MSARARLAFACVALLAGAQAAFAAPQTQVPAAGSTLSNFAGFDSIKTAQFHYNLNDGTFTFPEHFYATRAGTDIAADRGSGNSQRKLLHAAGHVVVHQEQAGSGVGGKASVLTQKPSTLTCDTLDVDGNRRLYTATGNMRFTQEGGKEATADRAILDDANHHLHMEGHVQVRDGERTMAAAVLDYDTLTGELNGNGDVTITAPVETASPGARPTATKKPKKKLVL